MSLEFELSMEISRFHWRRSSAYVPGIIPNIGDEKKGASGACMTRFDDSMVVATRTGCRCIWLTIKHGVLSLVEKGIIDYTVNRVKFAQGCDRFFSARFSFGNGRGAKVEHALF